MRRGVGYVLGAILFCASANSHEMTPTYPKLQPAFTDNILQTTMTILNKRSDVRFYEIGVFTEDFQPIQFAASERVVEIPYLSRKTINVYIRAEDKKKATYVCSMSKIEKKAQTASIVYSKICSKLK